jgi:hypothetical protein
MSGITMVGIVSPRLGRENGHGNGREPGLEGGRDLLEL